ncbi:MAG TPA: DegT/DnrJ/EryC1/StrS family aminotransferase [Ferrovibrio sp.]|uniref:DegT/DnrJ/EryC1/StrS family aminotransferase n=1 Tax=Ferrovibrio sp. TaxID=1917215 RepID=UPI002B4B2A2E|nr:DegT/DnrJ/EryC1/StrS family aminotransferase [Ferrovibrio sp.]HLT78111.1 DegT/DnrJ/EryC1/StrS family aminotransferase [Ferrovibrio sp.]
MIPQTNPKAAYLAQRDEIDAAIRRVLDSGWYIQGEEVAAFEREFAAFAGARHGIAVASGTDALIVALRALGVGSGDSVITVSHTAVATVAAIELTGATPVLVDVDGCWTMDPAQLDALLKQWPAGTPRPKAIIPVHLYGQPAAMPEIMAIADRHGLAVLEDNSQAHGARLDGKMVGRWGRIAAYSLYPTKNLGAIGDGGVITTDDEDLARAMREIREYGWRERYVSAIAGMNSRLDPLQAAILRVKLTRLDADIARRQAIAVRYTTGLSGIDGLRLPKIRVGASPVWHQYVIDAGDRRDALQTGLKDRGVATLVHYPVPVHLQPAYKGRVTLASGGLPHTERAAGSVLSLPMFPQLEDAQVNAVIAAVRQAWG